MKDLRQDAPAPESNSWEAVQAKLNLNQQKKKPLSLRWWYGAVAAILAIGTVGFLWDTDPEIKETEPIELAAPIEQSNEVISSPAIKEELPTPRQEEAQSVSQNPSKPIVIPDQRLLPEVDKLELQPKEGILLSNMSKALLVKLATVSEELPFGIDTSSIDKTDSTLATEYTFSLYHGYAYVPPMKTTVISGEELLVPEAQFGITAGMEVGIHPVNWPVFFKIRATLQSNETSFNYRFDRALMENYVTSPLAASELQYYDQFGTPLLNTEITQSSLLLSAHYRFGKVGRNNNLGLGIGLSDQFNSLYANTIDLGTPSSVGFAYPSIWLETYSTRQNFSTYISVSAGVERPISKTLSLGLSLEGRFFNPTGEGHYASMINGIIQGDHHVELQQRGYIINTSVQLIFL